MNKPFVYYFFVFFALFHGKLIYSLEEKSMLVIIPSYKNQKWCDYNISSILEQKYTRFRILYIDDASPDETTEKVKKNVQKNARACSSFRMMYFDDKSSGDIPSKTHSFVEKVNQKKAFFTLVRNVNRCGALENLYRAISSADDDEIIVTVDGDDWLPDSNVLERLNQIYSFGEVWMTHGKLIAFPSKSTSWCQPIPEEVVVQNAFRSFRCPSHLRTFYAWLFKKIHLDDLLYEGKFFPMTWDMAMMYPMIEMASERHVFVEVPNYVYNMKNPINDNKVDAELQKNLDGLIRNASPYQRLKDRQDSPRKE